MKAVYWLSELRNYFSQNSNDILNEIINLNIKLQYCYDHNEISYYVNLKGITKIDLDNQILEFTDKKLQKNIKIHFDLLFIDTPDVILLETSFKVLYCAEAGVVIYENRLVAIDGITKIRFENDVVEKIEEARKANNEHCNISLKTIDDDVVTNWSVYYKNGENNRYTYKAIVFLSEQAPNIKYFKLITMAKLEFLKLSMLK